MYENESIYNTRIEDYMRQHQYNETTSIYIYLHHMKMVFTSICITLVSWEFEMTFRGK